MCELSCSLLDPQPCAAREFCTCVLRGAFLQDLARAVHALYTQQLGAALPEALEAGMQAAADHACQAAAAACGALLPADVPPAAASTAAALVTASCKASCAQRLLQEVRACTVPHRRVIEFLVVLDREYLQRRSELVQLASLYAASALSCVPQWLAVLLHVAPPRFVLKLRAGTQERGLLRS